MKTTISILSYLLLLGETVLAQDSISGYYTYQTGARESGEVLDLRPDETFTLSSIRYQQITPIDSGKWTLKGDTLNLKTADTLFYLKVVSEYNLQTFLPNSIDPESPVAWLEPIHWTKTKSYHPNGQIKSTMSWTSISQFQHELIPHGLWLSYYENGNLKEIGKYKNGIKTGTWYSLWPDGKEKQA